MDYQQMVAINISKALSDSLSEEEVSLLLEKPKYSTHGDFAFPCFSLAKTMRKAPQLIASELAEKLDQQQFEKVEVVGPYVNFFLNKGLVSNDILAKILNEGDNYGNLSIGNGGNVTIDMSSPNIAKPFSMGHLRSTVIGNALANIVAKCGYTPIKINHLGDWGTQFGKLIVAYKKWGNEEAVRKEPIKELLKLYVQFHEEAEKDTSLEDEGRKWFKKLEDNDQEAVELWKWFREESLQEFNKIYKLLGISFDSYNGEAFYNDKMGAAIQLIKDSGLLVEDKGAQVVKLEEEELPPCLILKSDGATLYITRDLATAIYRKNTYDFAKSIYVVGNEQSLHFKQLKAVLKKLGFDWSDDMTHVPFGLILKDGKKMSTRKGKIILLEEVLAETIALAEQNISEKNPNLPNKEEVAKQVGVGAVIFHDLKNDRMNSVEYSLTDMLKFEGETGPYVQYTHTRACSILRKSPLQEGQTSYALQDELSWEVVKELQKFPAMIEKANKQLEPSVIAKYVVDLSQAFNKYYGNTHILLQDESLQARLALVEAVKITLKEGLRLLGIAAPEEM
ncbi:arginine--tRNA ligase [Bacillus massiliigorillae]|uniref:arginine--tRNA ligase n=1 Tax=Bacillus massiliigorillae TaxID=1243664 RepID=UPI0003998814|nr:arginine--tRNA ligase [Bacillus massiliigorillae]